MTKVTDKRSIRAKLIFNPSAGLGLEAAQRLEKVVSELQDWRILPEVFLG